MFMFRRFPILGLLLVGWLMLTILGGVGSSALGAVGLLLFLPILLFKMMFFFFIFGAIMGKFGPGRRHFGRHIDRGGRREQMTTVRTDPEWEQNLHEARTELDELFPDEA